MSAGEPLEDPEMSLEDHLEELRRRLIVSLAALVAGTAVLWAWSGRLLSYLAEPAGGGDRGPGGSAQ